MAEVLKSPANKRRVPLLELFMRWQLMYRGREHYLWRDVNVWTVSEEKVDV